MRGNARYLTDFFNNWAFCERIFLEAPLTYKHTIQSNIKFYPIHIQAESSFTPFL